MDSLVQRIMLATHLTVCAALVAAAEPVDPFARATAIQQEVAEIRGLPFKQVVPMEKQTPEGLIKHMQKEAGESLPDASEKHFDKIVRRLGLYRGPVIEDFGSMIEAVMSSQVAAYYDSDTRRIYLLNEGKNDMEQGVVYSHELYHALQDQYFDLDSFTADKLKLDGDQILARVAVVEGEATYMHTLWGLKQMLKRLPPRALVGPAIQAQADMDLSQVLGKAEAEDIPPFILEIMIGNYLKGAAFIFALQENDWSNVEKLYKEYPPQSTEQILHPEKWLAREGTSTFTWPNLGKQKALKDWELIDDDVLGEVQWRIIFKVQEQAADAKAAAGGWNGDRYAVLKRKKSDETLLLLRTSWDSEAEATQFTEAYRRVLAAKYKGTSEATQVEQQGTEVFIVEGGNAKDLPAMMKIVRSAKKSDDVKPAPIAALVATKPAPASDATLDELEAVLITGERPGPALWKVTRKGNDNVLWILPTFEPLPDSLVLRSAELERVIKESQSVHFIRRIEVPSSVTNDARTRQAMQNTPGKQLRDVVPPELDAQFRALADKYGVASDVIDTLRPVAAAEWMKQTAMKRLHLTDGALAATIHQLGRQYNVPVFGVAWRDTDIWTTMLARMDEMPREDDAACAKAKLDRIDSDLRDAVGRANAWADGDIAVLLQDSTVHDAQKEPRDCRRYTYFQYANRGATLQKPLKDTAYRSSRKWLAENRSTLVLLPISELFEKNGLIARLKRAGYQVQPPLSLSLPPAE